MKQPAFAATKASAKAGMLNVVLVECIINGDNGYFIEIKNETEELMLYR